MAIQPSQLQALLQLQLSGNFNPMATGSSTFGSDGSGGIDFASLIQMLAATDMQASPASEAVRPSVVPRTVAYHPGMKHVAAGPSDYDALIERSGARHGIDTALVKAVVHAESGFDPNAVSQAGAKGLMQLMDGTARVLGVSDSFDPEQNVEGGTRFLRDLLNKYNGNVGTALAAYNAGPGRIDQVGIANDGDLRAKYDRLPEETKQYVQRVLNLYENYRS